VAEWGREKGQVREADESLGTQPAILGLNESPSIISLGCCLATWVSWTAEGASFNQT
jgi:hypothetical protein